MPKRWSNKKTYIGMLIAGLMGGYVSGPEVEFLLIGPLNVGPGLFAAFVLLVGIGVDWE